MATIQELMPYLEQGFIAVDHVRMPGPAYLRPKKQADSLVFEWTAYKMEGEWAGPQIHPKDYVLTWGSNRWSILCHSKPGPGATTMSEYGTDKPERIEQAIADGLAYKADGFREEEKFTEEHKDYRLITEFIKTTLPTLSNARFLTTITDKKEGGYILTFTGDMNKGFYEIVLFVINEEPEKHVAIASLNWLVHRSVQEQ